MSDTPPADPPPAATTTSERKFTQEEVDRIAGRNRAEGKASGEKGLLAELGHEDVAAAKAANADHQARVDAEKTEAERARDEATAAKAEAQTAMAQMAAATQESKVQLALIEAGASSAVLADVARMVSVSADADAEAITEAVEALKSRVPQLFATPDGAPPAPSSAPAGGTGEKTKKPSTKKGLTAGAEMFAARSADK